MFSLSIPELISYTVAYNDRRSWFATLMGIWSLEETPEPIQAL